MVILADIVGTIKPTGVFVKGGASTLATKVHDLIALFIGSLIIVSVVMIIYNGIMFITAGGDSGKVEKAISGIIYSLIGLGVALGAGILVQFLVNYLK